MEVARGGRVIADVMAGSLRAIGRRGKIVGMRLLAYLVIAALALVASGCSSGSDSTPTVTATSSPGGTATAGPTAASPARPDGFVPVDGEASFIAIVEAATGQQVVRVNDARTWNTWFEPSGDAVSALVLSDTDRPRTVRLGLDGAVLVDSTETLLRVSADGGAEAYGGGLEGGTFFQTYLEVDGEIVELEGDPTALPLGFSSQGDGLLSYVGVAPTVEGEAAISYTIHGLDGSVRSTFVNRVSATEAGSQATWSPSGRYVAAAGIEGLAAHDVETGETIVLGESGSTEWSPAEDALLVIAGRNELQVVRLPGRETISIEVDTGGIAASFDPSGQVVTVSNGARRTTTIFDAATGEELLALSGAAEGINVVGFEPVVMTADGLAIVLEGAPGCEGVLVIHPALGVRGQCLIGSNPRWAPDADAVAFTRGSEVVVFEIETLSELVVASNVPDTNGGTLARWNDDGTHLLLEWPWGGGGWTDSLP
jgi:hypothetical protein